MTAPLEREVKLRFDDVNEARQAVLTIGATPLRPRRLQSDALFDTPDHALGARGQVLRVRSEDGRSFVTFKTPVPHETMKLREEFETSVGDARILTAILEQAGFHVWFRYEKYREEFRFQDVTVAIDETPVGTYVEIEGSAEGITVVSLALGRTAIDYVLDSYRTLFVRHCEERRVPAVHMLFPLA